MRDFPYAEDPEAYLEYYQDVRNEILAFGWEVWATLFWNLRARLKGDTSMFDGFEKEGISRIAESSRRHFGMKVEHYGELRPCTAEERAILTCNHPDVETIFPLLDEMAPYVHRLKGIMSAALLFPWNLPLGLTGVVLGKAIPIPLFRLGPFRFTGLAEGQVRRAVTRGFTPGTGVMIMPDILRPRPGILQANYDKFGPMYEHIGFREGFTYTPVPASGAIYNGLEAAPDSRLLDFTYTTTGPVRDQTLHVHREEIPQQALFDPSNLAFLPQDESKVPESDREKLIMGWGMRRWLWKNGWIRARKHAAENPPYAD